MNKRKRERVWEISLAASYRKFSKAISRRPHTSQSYKRVLLKCQNMNFDRARTNEATTKKQSDGARASYFRTGSSEKRRHCARARTLWTFCQGDLGHPSSSPPRDSVPPLRGGRLSRERDIVIFFSFLFVTNRLGRDMRCRRERLFIITMLYLFHPPTDLPISQKYARAKISYK